MRWPELASVRQAVTVWASDLAARRPDVRAVGYFGSLARGDDWGVGSDADLLVLIEPAIGAAVKPFERRAETLDASELPVPADVLVYTTAEWADLPDATPFHDRARREAVWVYHRDAPAVRAPQAP